jgi:hypothetical protein
MKKITILLLALVLITSLAMAVKTPTIYSGNRTRSGALNTKTEFVDFSCPPCTLTNQKNCTLLLADGASYVLYYGSKITMFANFKANAAIGVDSGDVKIMLEVGTDSTGYYVPIPDTVLYRDVALAADTLRYGGPGKWNRYKSFTQTLNDSTFSYQLYSVQPTGTGRYISLPIRIPEDINIKRARLILIPDTKFQTTLDTLFVTNIHFQDKRLGQP